MDKILPKDLLAFDDFTDEHPIKIDLVYKDKNHPHNIFDVDIYKSTSKLWGHKDMVGLTLLAAKICHDKTGLTFEIKDCLRPVEAQARMLQTPIVQKNIHWTIEPDRLLSTPGDGGHPRGMAIDIILLNEDGSILDMGTDFDHLSEDRENNPAARDFTEFDDQIFKNRLILEQAMMQAAEYKKIELLPLPQEWWDFRFLSSYTNQFLPINDKDLPKEMQMMEH